MPIVAILIVLFYLFITFFVVIYSTIYYLSYYALIDELYSRALFSAFIPLIDTGCLMSALTITSACCSFLSYCCSCESILEIFSLIH